MKNEREGLGRDSKGLKGLENLRDLKKEPRAFGACFFTVSPRFRDKRPRIADKRVRRPFPSIHAPNAEKRARAHCRGICGA